MKNNFYNQSVGRYGEDLAKEYLERKGYKIIGGNVKASYKEIDIIAVHEEFLVFVEVKTRTNKTYGDADEAIDERKIKRLKQAISIYLSNNTDEKEYIDVRLDFISVDINKMKNSAKIKHYQDII